MSEQSRSMNVSNCAHVFSSWSLIKSISVVKQGSRIIRSRRVFDPINEESTSTLLSFFRMISSSSSGKFINCVLERFIFNVQFTIILSYSSVVIYARVFCLTALGRRKSDVSVRPAERWMNRHDTSSLALFPSSMCFAVLCSHWGTIVFNIVPKNSIQTCVELVTQRFSWSQRLRKEFLCSSVAKIVQGSRRSSTSLSMKNSRGEKGMFDQMNRCEKVLRMMMKQNNAGMRSSLLLLIRLIDWNDWAPQNCSFLSTDGKSVVRTSSSTCPSIWINSHSLIRVYVPLRIDLHSLSSNHSSIKRQCRISIERVIARSKELFSVISNGKRRRSVALGNDSKTRSGENDALNSLWCVMINSRNGNDVSAQRSWSLRIFSRWKCSCSNGIFFSNTSMNSKTDLSIDDGTWGVDSWWAWNIVQKNRRKTGIDDPLVSLVYSSRHSTWFHFKHGNERERGRFDITEKEEDAIDYHPCPLIPTSIRTRYKWFDADEYDWTARNIHRGSIVVDDDAKEHNHFCRETFTYVQSNCASILRWDETPFLPSKE